MARKLVTLLVIASFATLVFAFAGCGGDDNSASGDTTTTETTTTEETETTDTETTETETTETTDTETTDTTETSESGFASAENCKEFTAFGQKISQAFSGSGDANLQTVADQLDELAQSAPEEIKSDFQTLADGYQKIADALGGVDLSSGQQPDPQALAELSKLGTEWSTKMTTAATNISTWAQQNCT
jgi:hypothetical protein